MLELLLGAVFAVSLIAVGYVYFGYPIVLLMIRGLRGSRTIRPVDILPSVSVIIVAHNEATVIKGRIRDIQAQDYPPERLEILVASDGSTDGTEEIVRGLQSSLPVRLGLVASATHVGRAVMHNRAVEAAVGQIMVFTDADTSFHPQFLRRAVRYFADDRVGCVSGRLIYRNTGTTALARGLGFYWKYEQWLRALESATGLYCFSSGACTAIRGELFRPLQAAEDVDTVCPLDTVLAGRWVVHASDAEAYDEISKTVRGEIGGRIRVIVQSMEGRIRRRELLNPLRYPGYTLAIFSHKLLRWHMAYSLIAALLSNVMLAIISPAPVWDWLLVPQCAFYAVAAVAAVLERRGLRLPVASIVLAFCIVNVGFLIGTWRFARGVRLPVYRSVE